jgi:cytochrome c6
MTTQAGKTDAGIGRASTPTDGTTGAPPATGATAATAAIGILATAILVLAVLAVPATAGADAAAGAALYKDKCVGCHGADGSGSTPMGKALKAGDLRKPEIQAKKDAELAASITNGKGKMPPQKSNLSAAQIGEIVTYIRTLAKK